ncbi:MAG: DASS family sodium-coupled anion symporter [Defluviitaleaceae bacterium]|nr:DASS family sodium-coupled anion symporter [Defluviitaleaceae bacterium]MCL2240185.1 DASS family sodium-coupled anion symporter [Defluviitaleaceae bacterium]
MKEKKIGFILGGALFLLFLAVPPPEGLSVEAWRLVAVTVLMAVFWVTEALPMGVTSLLPIVLYPVFGILPSGAVTSAYGDNIIFLFMGGFFLAVTMEKWNLHRRIALNTVRLTGTTPSKIILGFAFATLFISMWVSNTATAVMMIPIGIAVAKSLTGTATDPATQKKESNFTRSLMLMIAYAATIGGITTIIATPANALAVAELQREFGLEVSFFQWMLVGVPLAIVMVLIVWLILTRLLFRTGDLKLAGGETDVIKDELDKLGPTKLPEKLLLAVAGFMVLGWISRGFVQDFIPFVARITDTQISIFGAILLFMIPTGTGDRLLDWKTGLKIPWGILLLFGGGLSIALAFSATGLAGWIGGALSGMEGLSFFMVILISTAIVCCLTEVTSNTAIAALFIPIMSAFAVALDIHPFAMVMAVCLASSMCFAMPAATPPNAIAIGSGFVKIKDMAKSGWILNFVTIAMVVVAILLWLPLVWGVDIRTMPQQVLEFIGGR